MLYLELTQEQIQSFFKTKFKIMCVFIKDKDPHTAVNDITVVKILIIKNGKLITPFQEAVIPEIPCTMIAEGESDLTNRDKDGYYHIEGGYIHSLELDITRYHNIHFTFRDSSNNVVLVKSHIPVGSKYYYDCGTILGICSDKLVLDEIIPYDEAKNYCDVAPDSLIEEVLKHKEILNHEEVFEEEFKEELEEVCV